MKRGRVGTRTKLLEPLVDVPFECVMEPVERTLQNYHLDKNNDHEALSALVTKCWSRWSIIIRST